MNYIGIDIGTSRHEVWKYQKVKSDRLLVRLRLHCFLYCSKHAKVGASRCDLARGSPGVPVCEWRWVECVKIVVYRNFDRLSLPQAGHF